jgi:hypothetical protein
MQDSTDYSPEAVTALIEQTPEIIEAATEAGRAALLKYGDPRYTAHYETATIADISGMYIGPAINRVKFDKGGSGEVPAELSTAAHLAHAAAELRRVTRSLRAYLKNGLDDMMRMERESYEDEVRTLARELAVGGQALAEYRAIAAPSTPAIDLDATYTVTYPGDTEPTVIIPTVRTKTRPDGVVLTIIKGLTPLFAKRVDAIADEGNRMHTLTILGGAMICIRDTPEDDAPENGSMAGSYWRDRGTLATTYYGTRDLPVSAVLDLAEQLRAQLGL